MSKQIVTIDELQEYLQGVSSRATHHAGNVNQVVLALAGAIVLFKDNDTDIEIRTYDGSPANMLWVNVAGQRLAFAYRHETRSIEIRDRTARGGVLLSITNTTALEDVADLFEKLLSRTSTTG